MFQDITLHLDLIPLWMFTLGVPILIITFIILISSLLVYFFKLLFKSRSLKHFYIKMEQKLKEKSKIKRDLYRKIPHLLIFIGIFILWLIGIYVIYIEIFNLNGQVQRFKEICVLAGRI